MISILCPSRGRREWLTRLAQSAVETAAHDFELIVRTDSDDRTYDGLVLPATTFFSGPRDVLSKYWNECYDRAQGPYYFHCGDDIIFRTTGWDEQVIEAFDETEDNIAFVHGDDLDPNHGPKYGSHGFLHDAWVRAVGYFVPPYFSSDYNDTWLNDVADLIGRRIYVPIVTEHLHPAYDKAPLDQTHRERLERHARDKVDDLYVQLNDKRLEDAEKLRAAIREAK